jgi:hypothetical protein
MGAKEAAKTIKITKKDKDISVLTPKMQEVLPALLAQKRSKRKSTVSTRVASGSNSPVSGLTINLPLPEQPGQHQLQLRDRQSFPALVPKVRLMEGWVANSCQ